MKASSYFAMAALAPLAFALTPRDGHYHTAEAPVSSTVSTPGDYDFDQLWNLTTNFWDSFISPNNQAEAKKINSTLFSEDVKGKIDATRTFDGRELNTEYAFGLFAQIALNPGTFTLLGAPISYEITQFAGNKNVVACTVLVEFDVLPLGITYPIEVVGWFTFNSLGEISQYDATFLRGLDWQFTQMTVDGMKKFNLTSPEQIQQLVQTQLANSVCGTHEKFCTGDNQQYASTEECTSFLTNGTVPLGEAWQLGMDTVGCRMVHMNMVPARPEVHCAHLGPSGGGYCTNDRTYDAYTTSKYFTNQAFVPNNKAAKVVGSLNSTQANNASTNARR